jgi:mono/diheme cytochrome c family protein
MTNSLTLSVNHTNNIYSRNKKTLRIKMNKLVLIAASLLLVACQDSPDVATNNPAQIQSPQVIAGEKIYNDNCVDCHGMKAAGTVTDWQKPGADGKYPPPPLDGSAHAWHHNLKVLKGTIDRGGIPLGGSMPAFKDKLSEEDKNAVIAYIQSLWPAEILDIWKKNNPGS